MAELDDIAAYQKVLNQADRIYNHVYMIDDLPPPGSRGGPDYIEAPIQDARRQQLERFKNSKEAGLTCSCFKT